MKEHRRYHRSRLLEMFTERGFSASTDCEIMHLFKNIKEEEKETLAKKMIVQIESIKTEQEALQKIKELINGQTEKS